MAKKLKILLVDDEKDLLEIMGNRMKTWGYDVETVTNGQEALEIISDGGIDIVVLDYMMPDMNGLETLSAIRKSDPNIPVIMFTAYPDQESIKGSGDLGVSAYIPKLSIYTDAQSALKTSLDMLAKKINNSKAS